MQTSKLTEEVVSQEEINNAYELGIRKELNIWFDQQDVELRIASIRNEIHHLDEILWRLTNPYLKGGKLWLIAVQYYGSTGHAEEEKRKGLKTIKELEDKLVQSNS